MSELHAQHKDWLACDECGEVQTLVALSSEHQLACNKCQAVLHQGYGPWLQTASALTITALVLFIISQFAPFLTLEIGSQSQTATMMDGFLALFERKEWALAGLIITTIFLFPLFEIFAFLYLLLPYMLNKRIPGQRSVLRWLVQAQSWSMLEVFMLGMVVTTVKLNDMAVVHLELGAYAFFLLVGVLILAFIKMDRRKLWAWININNYYTEIDGEEVYSCATCKAMVGGSIVDKYMTCPRCRCEMHRRIPHSLQKTLAYVAAATILYIPANILPIMSFDSFGEFETDTIMSGIIELMEKELWGIAIIVFVASILVPIVKLIVLCYLVYAVHTGMQMGRRHRIWLYRVTELIGRWSMVDVYVVTIIVALVQFGFVYTVEPRGALVAFAGVVILTILAVESFDPRLLWDELDKD